jgi:hypothetical protein
LTKGQLNSYRCRRFNQVSMRRNFFAALALAWLSLGASFCWAQQSRDPGTRAIRPAPNAEFLRAADEVLAEMSQLLSLPIREPLKKSVRSREEIREFLIRQMREDRDDAKRYADQKAMEAMGLIPKGYPLEQKMIALLTEQIAGLYDPKAREFFIADWTGPGEQRMVMAHELTHALQDQSFHLEKWEEAVRNNDDAQLAREAVLEGSAMIGMVDYLLRSSGKSSRDMDDFDASVLLGDVHDSPELSQAPLVIQDELLFPYATGAGFVHRALKNWNGWPDLHKLFENPPASTQQILHPERYFQGVAPARVDLPPLARIVPREWKKLDENVLGEFGINEILKQFLGKDRAEELASLWVGDRYAISENLSKTRTLLVMRVRLVNDAAAARFFGGYSDLLERKNQTHRALLRRPNFFSFETPAGGVFLRCFTDECLIAEGATREMFDAMTRAMRWPLGPPERRDPGQKAIVTAMRQSRGMESQVPACFGVPAPCAPAPGR